MQCSLLSRHPLVANNRKAILPLLLTFHLMSSVCAQSVPMSKVWDKTFGGPVDDYLRAAIATPDTGYLLGGYSFQGSEGGANEDKSVYNYLIVKVDRSGKKEWSKSFGG